MSKLIFGCGYLGRRVAERWLAAGERVFAVTRVAEHARRFDAQGIVPVVADVTRPATLAGLPAAKTVLYAVGYDRTAGVSIHELYVAGLKAALDALPESVEKLIYISSTGVYGQNDGGWVDEDSPCHPEREGGKACLAAERLLAAHPMAGRAAVLRLAGIYGPGRIPRRADLLAGQPLAAPPGGFLNLIHVDDAAAAVLAAEAKGAGRRTYLVSDGHPIQRREYYEELARLVGAPPPQFQTPAASSPAAARAGSDKRARNDRLRAELGLQLAYPSYREGLAAIVAAENAVQTDRS
jgi:nucleoside-diphosphate-sugar epimerase